MGIWHATLKAFSAIYTGSNVAADPRKSIGSRWWLDAAPNGTAYPYAVYKVVDATQDAFFNAKDAEDIDIDVVIVTGPTSTQCADLADAFAVLFHKASLTFGVGDNLTAAPVRRAGPAVGPFTDPDGVWQMTVPFAVRTSK